MYRNWTECGEIPNEIISYCNCSLCEHYETCPHENAYRRYPVEYGGAGACKKLNLANYKLIKEEIERKK